ncbi:hypothetical protein BJ165DRAFT_266246 [Panaeolus papilionaceus]|nr:hypothetical protein BJ165DRAFT_266246 [Panaeolus papilionaceus]
MRWRSPFFLTLPIRFSFLRIVCNGAISRHRLQLGLRLRLCMPQFKNVTTHLMPILRDVARVTQSDTAPVSHRISSLMQLTADVVRLRRVYTKDSRYRSTIVRISSRNRDPIYSSSADTAFIPCIHPHLHPCPTCPCITNPSC